MNKIRKSITLETAVSDALKKKAAEQSRSFSSMVEIILKKWLKANENHLEV